MPNVKPPTGQHFTSHIVDELFRLITDHTDPFVQLDEAALKRICLRAGFDPDHLSKYGHAKDGWFWSGIQETDPKDATSGRANGLKRYIGMEFARMCNETNPRAQRPKEKGKNMIWGLTERGLAEGRSRAGNLPPIAVNTAAKAPQTGQVRRTVAKRLPGRDPTIPTPGTPIMVIRKGVTQ